MLLLALVFTHLANPGCLVTHACCFLFLAPSNHVPTVRVLVLPLLVIIVRHQTTLLEYSPGQMPVPVLRLFNAMLANPKPLDATESSLTQTTFPFDVFLASAAVFCPFVVCASLARPASSCKFRASLGTRLLIQTLSPKSLSVLLSNILDVCVTLRAPLT